MLPTSPDGRKVLFGERVYGYMEKDLFLMNVNWAAYEERRGGFVIPQEVILLLMRKGIKKIHVKCKDQIKGNKEFYYNVSYILKKQPTIQMENELYYLLTPAEGSSDPQVPSPVELTEFPLYQGEL